MSTMTNEPGATQPRADRRLAQSSSALRPVSRHATITVGGLLYVGVTLFLAVGAVNAQNNLLFWLFGVAIALLVTSGVLSGNALMHLQARCLRIAQVRVGETHQIQYEFTSSSRLFPLFGVLIVELSFDELDDYRQASPAVLLHLSPNSTERCSSTFEINRRGLHHLRSFHAESSFPFGFIRKWVKFEQPRSFVALPCAIRLKPTLIREHADSWSDDPRPLPKRGDGSDYFGLRSYIPGDPRRRIAWKQSARRGSLVVIEHAEETSPRMMIWLRSPDPSDDPIQLERAIALVAAVAKQAIGLGAAVGVWIPWADIRITPDTGNAQIHRIENDLALLEAAGEHASEDSPPNKQLGKRICISTENRASIAGAINLDASDPSGWLAKGEELPRPLRAEMRS